MRPQLCSREVVVSPAVRTKLFPEALNGFTKVCDSRAMIADANALGRCSRRNIQQIIERDEVDRRLLSWCASTMSHDSEAASPKRAARKTG